MSWRDLLGSKDEKIVHPWTGGRRLLTAGPEYALDGGLPPEHGWHEFSVLARKARWSGASEPRPTQLVQRVAGYLVGDRIVPDASRPTSWGAADVAALQEAVRSSSETVHLLEPGLRRFARVSAGRSGAGAPLVFVQEEMPLGPEDGVLAAFQDRRPSLDGVKDVPPALDAAFRLESWQRSEAERRRAEIERARREEEARRAEEERVAGLRRQLSHAEGRRAMAAVDFATAAAAALAVSGAEYLDHRASTTRGETAVTFRLDGRRFECVCDSRTLRIVDSGICLVSHRTGERGDDRFTLESLPAVIRQASREGVLHVFRHVAQDPGFYDEDQDEGW